MIQTPELLLGAIGLVATLAFRVFTANRLIRSKLRLALFSFAGQLVLGGALWSGRGLLSATTIEQFHSVTHLLLALGAVTFVVVTAINPWRVDKTPEHFPNIVQDTIIIGIFMVIGTSVMQEKFLTTSAVGAVVIGFALQDTLGNTFAGLAIQVEKPFRVDQWVRIGSLEGRVVEITWRATRLRTKSGDAVIVPNNIVSKEAITNFSEPAGPTRLDVEVGVSYQTPPNHVKAVILERSPRRAAGADRARAGSAGLRLRRVVHHLPDQVLGRPTTARTTWRATRCGAASTTRSAGPESRSPSRSRSTTARPKAAALVADGGPGGLDRGGRPVRAAVGRRPGHARRSLLATGCTAPARRSSGRATWATRCSSWAGAVCA